MKLRISLEEAIELNQFINSLEQEKLSTRKKEEKLRQYLDDHFAEKCGTVTDDDLLIINKKNLI